MLLSIFIINLNFTLLFQLFFICWFSFAANVEIAFCRYDFPWTPTKYIPFYGGPDYHDYHHYVGGQSQSNFASVFTYCDYIYGTDKVITKANYIFHFKRIVASIIVFLHCLFFFFSPLIFQGYRYQKKVLKQVHNYLVVFNM